MWKISPRIRSKIYCVSCCSQLPYLGMNVTVEPCFGILFPVRSFVFDQKTAECAATNTTKERRKDFSMFLLSPHFRISNNKDAYLYLHWILLVPPPTVAISSRDIYLDLFQKSAQTVLRGCEEPCGSPRVRTMSGSRAPPLFSRLSETSSADESMSDLDSVPCSPLILPCSPLAAPGSLSKSPIGTRTSTFIT